MNKPTPWAEWLNLAALSGITPPEFWRLSYPEFRALARTSRVASPSSADLKDLIKRVKGVSL